MANQFILSSESTIDLPVTHVNQKNIPVIHYAYTVDGVEYTDNMDEASVAAFYEKINAGAKPLLRSSTKTPTPSFSLRSSKKATFCTLRSARECPVRCTTQPLRQKNLTNSIRTKLR